MRVRGLKLFKPSNYTRVYKVAPHAGAWIETVVPSERNLEIGVAPHAGAWIETKYPYHSCLTTAVAPHAGAWIETYSGVDTNGSHIRRIPCGCVD